MQVAVKLRLYEYGHEQVQLRKKTCPTHRG